MLIARSGKQDTAPTSSVANAVARAGLEADLPRQARRLRRIITGTSAADELRAAVHGKRVLVTGASSGIGRAVALRLISAGAEVILVARRAVLLAELVGHAQALGGQAHAYPCDLSVQREVELLAADIIAQHGGVDIVINNAGRSIRRTLADSTDRVHDFDRVMRLNYFGAVWLTAPLVARMRSTSGGHVINVSTMGTQFRGTPRFAAYMASKGALDQFAGSVAPETLPDGVTWTTVHLPLVRTDMIAPAASAWRTTPTLSLNAGTDMVADAVVRRPARVTSPLGTLVGVLDWALPRAMTAVKSREFAPSPKLPLPRVAIVGAGMSGLTMAIRLQAAGHGDFTVYEQAQTPGGTWRGKTYPACTTTSALAPKSPPPSSPTGSGRCPPPTASRHTPTCSSSPPVSTRRPSRSR